MLKGYMVREKLGTPALDNIFMVIVQSCLKDEST